MLLHKVVELIELMDGLSLSFFFPSHCMFTWIFMYTFLAPSLLVRTEGFNLGCLCYLSNVKVIQIGIN